VCGLWLETHALPYVEDYYIIFKDYKRDDEGYSLLEDKDLMMNFGDVLLAVDGLDIEGKNLDNIRNMLKGKRSNTVKLTFLNKQAILGTRWPPRMAILQELMEGKSCNPKNISLQS